MTTSLCQKFDLIYIRGLNSLSRRTSYRKISWSLQGTRFEFKLIESFWNLTSPSTAPLSRCLSNFRPIQSLELPISQFQGVMGRGGNCALWDMEHVHCGICETGLFMVLHRKGRNPLYFIKRLGKICTPRCRWVNLVTQICVKEMVYRWCR